ncbi:glycosyltransferase family 2 protein [Heyndrickxia acidiproducens]|uniref:glycosyltransferase family 2 protein n=1 Tax=Heyndrickxia acidiproducens TaxID=1121084 RepID=UPI0003650092|nr:glycosyltransferase family 2 protein [Heyndrickxia acidiproducens]
MGNDSIKVSVIVPLYNVENYIDEALSSLVNQTLKSIEIILVDDFSRDKTLKIVSSYTQKYSNVYLIQQTQKMGVGAARNLGLKIAHGEYIFFMDADDFITRNALEQMYIAAEENNANLVTGVIKEYYDARKSSEISPYFKIFPSLAQQGEKSIIKNPELFFLIYCWGKLYKKSLIENSTFPMNIHFAEDQPFTVHAYLYTNKIFTISSTIYYYRKRESEKNSVSQSLLKDPALFLKNVLEIVSIGTDHFSAFASNRKNQYSQEVINSLYIYYLNRVVNREIIGILYSTLAKATKRQKLSVLNILNNWIEKLPNSLLVNVPSFNTLVQTCAPLVKSLDYDSLQIFRLLLKNMKLKMGVSKIGNS